MYEACISWYKNGFGGGNGASSLDLDKSVTELGRSKIATQPLAVPKPMSVSENQVRDVKTELDGIASNGGTMTRSGHIH